MSAKQKNLQLESLSKLEAQRIQALQNNDTKTASLIQKIINLIKKKD